MTQTDPDGSGSGSADLPLRVSTLELFFDLVFVFAITQLTGILSHDVTVADGFRVLLIFGALWWMYGGYVWLSNARTPIRTPERLLMLVGMAGFLVMGLAILHAFGRDGVALGIGYLIVVVVHAWLYQRINRNIARVAPFNLAAALLIIGAGVARRPGRLCAVGGRAGRRAGLPAVHPGARPVRHPAVALHRTARRADHRGVRRVRRGHRARCRRPRRDRIPGAVGGAGAGAGRRAVVGLLRRR